MENKNERVIRLTVPLLQVCVKILRTSLNTGSVSNIYYDFVWCFCHRCVNNQAAEGFFRQKLQFCWLVALTTTRLPFVDSSQRRHIIRTRSHR